MALRVKLVPGDLVITSVSDTSLRGCSLWSSAGIITSDEEPVFVGAGVVGMVTACNTYIHDRQAHSEVFVVTAQGSGWNVIRRFERVA